jgi:coatomer subunit beta
VVEYLSDTNELAAVDVVTFVREIVHKYANLKELILKKLLEIFPSIKSVKIMRSTMWILGEYCETTEDIQNLITMIRQSLGDLPIVDDELKRAAGIENKEDEQILRSNTASVPTQQLVTADGTYATQSAFTVNAHTNASSSNGKDDLDKRPTFRGFLLQGHFFIAAALARTLAKLSIKYARLVEGNQLKQNRFSAETMLIMASILHFGKSGMAKKPINEDDTDSINVCLRVISDRSSFIYNVFYEQSQQVLSTMLDAKLNDNSAESKGKQNDQIHFVIKNCFSSPPPLK